MGENRVEIIISKSDMQKKTLEHKRAGKTIGFVPTMGFLHEGHLKLVEHSVEDNDITILSIFVNPLQFGPNEDFESYPRDQERDKKLAMNAGVDYIFMPDTAEMYRNELSFSLNVDRRADVLCGSSRPGHFNGVATVLIKLFNIIQPDNVYFGTKDAQQTAIVEALIEDFDFPLNLKAVQTARDPDGLAKSSRNVYLSPDERKQAVHLYHSLKLAEEAVLNGIKDTEAIIQLVKDHIEEHTNGHIDYVDVLSYPQLTYISELQGKVIVAVAVKFSKARLIDNIIFSVND